MMWLKKEQPKERGNNEKVNFQDLPSLLTIDQVSEILKVHPNTLRNWDRSGRLKAVRIGPRKDRRYEKLSVEKFYKELQPGQIIKDFSKKPEEKKLPPPEEEKYIIKPGLSLEKIRLLLLSKRFSVFVYSAAIVAFTFLTLQVTFFAYLYMVQAEEKPSQAIFVTIEPNSATGWENTGKAKHIDALSSSPLSDFNQKISAVYSNKPVAGEDGEKVVVGEEVLVGINPVFEAYDYYLAGKVPFTAVLKDVKVVFSMAADSFEGNEDVITLELSLDYGKTWEVLDSFALLDDASNVTNEGYWEYSITDKVDKVGDLEEIRTRVKYNSVPGAKESIAYLDGVAIKVEAEGPDPTTAQIYESVVLKKKDVTASESPVIEVNTKDKGFLGIGTKKRTIKDFTVTDADGDEVKVEYEITEKEEKGKIISGYEIDTESLEKPGRYNITMEVEQDGQIEEIKKEFTWGMLVLNTDQSVYKTGQPAIFSLGAFDEYGGIICDADLELVITDPEGQVVTLSSENGGIETSKDCLLKGVTYEQADYEVSYIPGVAGAYTAELKAIYHGSTRSISRNFSAEITPLITIKRHGPTRVNPNEFHTMSLEIISDQDFSGEIRERVPNNFSYAGPEDCSLESINDSDGQPTGYREIVCNVDIKRDASNFFTYQFISLHPKTTYFDFGPTVIKGPSGDYSSQHKWDIYLKEGKVEKEILDKIAAGESPNIITKLRTAEKTVNIDRKDFSQEEKTGEYASGVVTSEGLDQLIASADVESISIDQPVSVLLDEAIPLINALPEDRPDGQTGTGKKICIVDTGVDYNHPAITNYKAGYDFINNDDDPMDDHGHGTSVAGVVSAIAPDSELYIAKVVDGQGNGNESDILAGLEWCIDQKVDVINISIGGGNYDGFCDVNPVAEMVNKAASKKNIFVAAATGNDGSNSIKAPSCAFYATRVSSTNKRDEISGFANVNLLVDLFAPGEEVSMPAMGGDYEVKSGTSFSSPMVAASAALVLEEKFFLPEELKYRLRSTGQPIAYSQRDINISIARLDVSNALNNEFTVEPYRYSAGQSEGPEQGFVVYELLATLCAGGGVPNGSSCCQDTVCSAGRAPIGSPIVTNCDLISQACAACCSASGLNGSLCSSTKYSNSYTWTGSTCCGDDASEYWVTQGVGSGACCTSNAANICVDSGNVCRDEYSTEVTCTGGIDEDCDGDIDGADSDCTGGCSVGDPCSNGSVDCAECGSLCINGTCRASGTCSSYDGYGCSTNTTTWSLSTAGTCTSTECDYTNEARMDCGTTCSLGTDVAYSACTSIYGDSCDSDAGGNFSQNGICASGATNSCATSGFVFYDSGFYDSSQVTASHYDYDLDSTGKGCDSALTNGDFFTTGMVVLGSTCQAAGSTVRVDNSNENYYTNTCDQSGDLCDNSITNPIAGGYATYGICATNVCETGDVCLNAGNYYNVMSSCADNDQCDSDVGTVGFQRDGYVCNTYSLGCVVDGARADGELCCTNANCSNNDCSGGTCAVAGITIGGRVYQENKSTSAGSGILVQVNVNGINKDSDTTDVNGDYSTSVPAESGDIITVYLDDHGTYEGTTVFKVDGTNTTDVSVFANAVIVRNDTGTSITNTNLATGDGGDDDIKYNVVTNNLTVDSEFELHIWTGDTYDPGGTVTTQGAGGDLHVDNSAIAYLDTVTNTISAEITIDTGATLHVQQTTNVNGTGSAVTIAGGTLNHTAGTFTIGNGTDEDMIITSGAANFSGGTTIITDELDINGGTVTISNTFNLTNANSNFEVIGDATVNINTGADVNLEDRLYLHGATATINVNDGSIDSVDYWLLYEGTFNFNGGTHNVGTTSGFFYLYDVGAGLDFNMAGNGTITTDELYADGVDTTTTTTTGGTIIINGGANGLDIRKAGLNFFNITIAASTAIDINTVEVNIVNDLTINNAQTLTTNGETVDVGDDVIINSSALISAGASSITVGGDWTNGGTYTAETSTVIMTGTSSINGTADTTFNNLTIGDGTAGTVTVNGTDDPTVSGTLNVDTGDTLSIDFERTLSNTGSSDVAGTGTISGAGTLRFTNASGGPGTSISTLSSVVRFDASAGNITSSTFDARTYGGAVEAYLNSASSYSVTAPSTGTFIFNSTLTTMASGGGTLTLDLNDTTDPTVTVGGALTIGSSTIFQAPSSTNLTLNGNYTNNGTFTDNSGTVILAGTSKQTLGGNMTTSNFYNLTITNTTGSVSGCATSFIPGVDFAASATISGTYTITTGGVKVEYNSGSTYTITNINWAGASGNEIIFRNSDLVLGTWLLNVSGTQTAVQYVNVGRSDATGSVAAIAALVSTDCNNNTNWTFEGGPDYDGIVYTDASESTPINGVSVCVAVDNVSDNDCDATNVNGEFTIVDVDAIVGGEQLTFFIDGGATFGNTVTISDGNNIVTGGNLRIYQNHVMVRYEQGSLISITDMDAYDNDQNSIDMLFDAENLATDTLILESGAAFMVYNSMTFDPNGTVTTNSTGGDFHVDDNATAIIDTATSNIGRDVLVDGGGTLTINADTNINGGDITTSGTSATIDTTAGTPTVTISSTGSIGGGTTPTLEFHNLTTTGTGTTLLSDAVVTNGDVSVGSGTTLGGGADLTVYGGDLTGLGTVTMVMPSTVSLFLDGTIGGSSNDWRFYDISFDQSAYCAGSCSSACNFTTTTSGSGDYFIGNTWTSDYCQYGVGGESMATHKLDGGSQTWILEGLDADPGMFKFLYNTSTVRYTYPGAATVGGRSYYNLELQPSLGTPTYTLESSTMYGNLTIDTTVDAATTGIIMKGDGMTIDANGQTFDDFTIDNGNAVTVINTDFTATDDFWIQNNSTLTINSGRTVTSLGPGNLDFGIDTGSTINGAGTVRFTDVSGGPGTTGTLSSVVRFDATADNILSTTFDARTYGGAVEVYSTRSSSIITTPSGTITFQSTLDIMATGVIVYLNFQTNSTTATVVGDFTIGTNTAFLASPGTLTLKGNYTNNGTFDHNDGTVVLAGTTKQTLSGNMTVEASLSSFYNLTITNSSNGTFSDCGAPSDDYAVSFAAAATVSGKYTITTAGTSVEYLSGATYTVSNGIEWTGASGAGNAIYFRNSVLGGPATDQWNLNVSGTQTDVSYVNVGRSDALGGDLIQAGNGTNTDCSYNENWNFYPYVSGSSNGSGDVYVAVNASVQADSDTIAGGTWLVSLGSTPSSGDIITVYIDDGVGDTDESTAVTKYDGSGHITNMVLDTHVLSIGSDDNPSLTLANLGVFDYDNNENVMHTANGTTLTVDGEGVYSDDKISILDNATLTIGAETLAARHVEVKNVSSGGTLTSSDASVINVSGNLTLDGVFNKGSSTVTMTGTGTLTSAGNAFHNLTLSGTITLANETHSIGGNMDMTSGTITAGTSTVTMTGTSNTITGGGNTLYNLTINPATAGTITLQTSDLTVSGALNVATGDTLSVGSGRILTLDSSGGSITLEGIISGDGEMLYRSTVAFPSTGTFTVDLRLDLIYGNQILGTRASPTNSYGGNVSIIPNISVTTPRTVTMGTAGGQGIDITGYLYLDSIVNESLMTLDGATHNPDVTIGGELKLSAAGVIGTPVILNAGSGYWTVSGNVDLGGYDEVPSAQADFIASDGGTLEMDGTGDLDAASGDIFHDLVLSGSVTLTNVLRANVTGSLNMTGGTITAVGVSLVTMTGTSETITGGGATLKNLTIDPATAGTITLQTSDLTVGGVFDVATGDTLSISSERTLSNTGSSNVAGTGTISGAGTLRFTDVSGGPGTTLTTLSSIVRFDASAGNIASTTFDARVYAGAVEAYLNSVSSYSVTAPTSGTFNFNSTLTTTASGGGTLTLDFDDTSDPTVTVGGALTIGSSTVLQAPSSTNLTLNGNYTNNGTFTDNSGTVILAGTSKQTLSGNMTTSNFYNLTITNTTGSVSDCATSFIPGVDFAASATISGTYTITTAGVNVEYNSGSTYTVNNINWNSPNSEDDIIFRNSDLALGTWLLNVSGTQIAVSDVNVGRSNASGGSQIMATDGTNTNCLNNTNWKFGFNISGIAYTNEGTTPLDGSSVNKTVNLRINGSGAYTDEITSADGAWQVTDAGMTAGSVVTLYLNDETEEATTVFISDASDQTNVNLYQNWVIVRADSGSITNANLSTGDDVDDDVKYNIATGNLTVDSGFSLHVWTGDTYAPGGTVTTQGGGSAHINTSAVFNAGGNNVTINGSWDNDGTYTPGANTTLFNATASGKTIDGSTTTFNNVDFNGAGGGWSTAAAMDIGGTFDLTVGSLTQAADNNINVAGNFTIADGTTFTKASGTGLLILDGDLVFSDDSVTKQDVGNVQIGTSPDITDLGSDMKANGVTIKDGDTLRTNGFEMDIGPNGVTVEGTGTLNVTDSDQNGDGKFEADTTQINTTGKFDIQAAGGTFTDTDGDSTLTFDGPVGTDTLTTSGESLSNLVINGNAGLIIELQDALDINNNLTITIGQLDTKNGVNNSITIGGNWTNNDTFTAQSGTVTADGSSQQTFSGIMTGATGKFYDLIIANADAANPDVIFSANAETANNFTATTASTQLQFNAGSAYTFNNIIFNGQATGTRIFLRSSATDTQWNLTSNGTQSVSNTNVRDSNACGGDTVDASDGTNFDATNNDCWLINSISFSISDVSIGFGDLNSSAARWATGDTTGSDSDSTAAHTILVSTNADNGYVIIYNGSTLTSGSNTIPDAPGNTTIANDADGTPGTEEFAISLSTSGDATIAAGYDHNATPADRDWKFVNSSTETIVSETVPTATETIDVYYIANISGQTEAGNYSTSVTYIVTPTF